MKKIILISMLLLLCGCQNKISEYQEVSDIVVSLFQKKTYNNEGLNDKQKQLLDNYIADLKNPEINLDDFIIYKDLFKTNDENTKGVYLIDDKCYIRYDDVHFINPSDNEGEVTARIVCNGYYTYISKDSVKPFDYNQNKDKYNYNYLGYYKDNGYNFVYSSYYDESGLVVHIGDKIEVEFRNVDSLKLKTFNSNESKPNYFRIVGFIVLIVLSGITYFLYKKKNSGKI